MAEIAALKASEEAAQRMSEALLLEAEKQAAKLAAGRKAIEEKAAQLQALRARETAAAAAKLKETQLVLREAQEQGRKDVSAAREEARKAAIAEMETRAAARGQMAMTEVISRERAENPKQTYYTPVYSPKTDTNSLSPSYILD